MVYSEVVNKGLILPKEDKYTMRHVKNIVYNSLFKAGGTMSEGEAIFICKCSAIFHNTGWSKALGKRRDYIGDI